MLNVPYTECGNCYLLTNFADSNNPMFTDKTEVADFEHRLYIDLPEIAEILSFSAHYDQFQLVVVLKEERAFQEFYRKKKNDPELDVLEIPEPTYILSQVISNVESGYAKKFNKKHKRYGSLFGRRYTKVLLETKDEVEETINAMHEGKKVWDFERIWSYVYNFLKKALGLNEVIKTTRVNYEGGCEAISAVFPGFLPLSIWQLRGSYVPVRLKC